jgi:hypothetical protein
MTEDQRQWAINRIRAKRAFWVHLTVYILVNALLVFIWAINASDYFWPMWPMLGWGIGVVAHAVGVGIGTSEIAEERIAREIESRATVGR